MLKVGLNAVFSQHEVLEPLVSKVVPQQILKVGLNAVLPQHEVLEPDVTQLAVSEFLRIIKVANKKNKIFNYMIF
jgi:hypothetical protein